MAYVYSISLRILRYERVSIKGKDEESIIRILYAYFGVFNRKTVNLQFLICSSSLWNGISGLYFLRDD